MGWLSSPHRDTIKWMLCSVEMSNFELGKIPVITLTATMGKYCVKKMLWIVCNSFRFASTITKLDFFDMVSVEKHTGTMDSWCGSNADCNYFELFMINWLEIYFQKNLFYLHHQYRNIAFVEIITVYSTYCHCIYFIW